MSNKPVTDALKAILADTYTLQIKTQNYHWNVEGTHFRSLHLLFEEQYNELFAAVDVRRTYPHAGRKSAGIGLGICQAHQGERRQRQLR